MRPDTTILWLKIGAALVIGFGVLTIIAAWPPANPSIRMVIDLAYWPLDGAQTFAAPESRLVFAVLGAVLIGWGVLLWLLASRLYLREPDLVRGAVLTSALVWFVLDGIASIVAGAPLNILLNLPFLLVFVLPLSRRAPRPAGMMGQG